MHFRTNRTHQETRAAPVDLTLESWDVVVRPPDGWVALNLRELWAYRELLYFLIWRNLKIRYKQTVLGALWAVLQPFMTMVVFSIFFGELARIPSGDVPYPIFAYTALVIWTYFSTALTQASNSLVEHERMITKVYFPRLLLPLSSTLSGLVDFAIAFAILVGMMLWFGIVPTAAIVATPLFVLLAVMTSFGVGLWLAALNVQYRDVRYVLGFLVQFWLFATPVAYSSDLVPDRFQAIYGLNPMAGVVEGFRWAMLGESAPSWGLMAVSAAMVCLLLAGGLYYFRRLEESFADVV